jgi:hypothetical protein
MEGNMALAPVVQIDGLPQYVALLLMQEILKAEKPKPTRKQILDTYVECLKFIKNPSARSGKTMLDVL